MPTEQTVTRNQYFDILKGVGIVAVFIGHSACWGSLVSRCVFSFHMPLFFLVSGVFFDFGKVTTWYELLRKVCRNLLIPYLFFCVVSFSLMFDVQWIRWKSEPVGKILGIISGRGGPSIWFLSCLAMVQLCVFCLNRWFVRLGKDLLALWPFCVVFFMCLAQVVSWWMPSAYKFWLPLRSASLPAGCVFFLMGWGLRTSLRRLDGQLTLWRAIVLAVLCLASVTGLCYWSNRCFDLANALFSCGTLPQCALGFLLVFAVARVLYEFSWSSLIFSWVGRASLCFFALEQPVSHIVDRLTGGRIPYPLWEIPHGASLSLIRCLVILLCVSCFVPGFSWILERIRRTV